MSSEDKIRQLLEKLLTEALSCEQWGTFGVEFDVAGAVITEWRDTSQGRHRPEKVQKGLKVVA